MTASSSDSLTCSNGPLPVSLEPRAYFTAKREEFALGASDALEYLDWCDQQGFLVLGFDTWKPTQPGPTVVIGREFEGNASACREKIRSGDFTGVVLNIWVQS